jgi:hypothetical protein
MKKIKTEGTKNKVFKPHEAKRYLTLLFTFFFCPKTFFSILLVDFYFFFNLKGIIKIGLNLIYLKFSFIYFHTLTPT